MSTNENNPIDFGAFTTKHSEVDREPLIDASKEPHRGAAPDWPSRQAPEPPKKVEEDQVSIKGPKYIIEAFKASSKSGRARIPYFDRIETLMALEDKLKEVGQSERSDPMDTLEYLINKAAIGKR